MTKKEQILAGIAELKTTKPDGWKRSARRLLWMLRRCDDPYGKSEYHGTENSGRHLHGVDRSPAYDAMDDNSKP